ncbi:MAG: DNA repair protein RecO [Ignavibacteria bacterium]|nr:DNA repair protein RecO [Ignavibacteria bacterium]
MALITDEAYVLRSVKYGDTSKILSLYSKENGKINCIVKGARNLKSRVLGVIEPFNKITIVFYHKQNRDLQMLSKAETITNFAGMKSDLDKLEIGYRILEMMNKAVYDNEHSHELFELLSNTFTFINRTDEDSSFVYLYFQIHLCEVLGISPIDKSDTEGNTFKSKELLLNKMQLEIIKQFLENDIEKILVEEGSSETILNLMSIYDNYLSDHTENFLKLKSVKVFSQMNLN